MTMDANELLDEVQTVNDKVAPHIREAADFFHEHEGELFERDRACELLEDETSVGEGLGEYVVSKLVADTVDPVVQVTDDGTNYVGVVEFHEFDGAYGYVEYDDVFGRAKRVVCQKCVNDASQDSEVTHATAGDPHGSFDSDADYDELLAGVHEHYDGAHDCVPSEIETGASLATGTTIGGNTSVHNGNLGTVDVTSLGSSSGTNGQFLSTDGSNPNWVAPPGFDGTNVTDVNISNFTDFTEYQNTSGDQFWIVDYIDEAFTLSPTSGGTDVYDIDAPSHLGIFVPDGWYYYISRASNINYIYRVSK